MADIFQLNRNAFEPVPGDLATISAGLGGVWGTNSQDEIFTFIGERFSLVPGALRVIAVGDQNNVWGLNRNDELFRFNPKTGFFEDNIQGSLKHLWVGAGGVWGLNSNSLIFKLNASTGILENIPGTFVQLAVGDNDHIFGLTDSGEILRFDQSTRRFDKPPIPGVLETIAASGSEVWGLNSMGQIFKFDNAQNLFMPKPGQLTRIAVGDSTTIWGLAGFNEGPGPQGGFPFHFDENEGVFHKVDRSSPLPGAALTLVAITAAPRGQIIVPGIGGAVWGLHEPDRGPN